MQLLKQWLKSGNEINDLTFKRHSEQTTVLGQPHHWRSPHTASRCPGLHMSKQGLFPHLRCSKPALLKHSQAEEAPTEFRFKEITGVSPSTDSKLFFKQISPDRSDTEQETDTPSSTFLPFSRCSLVQFCLFLSMVLMSWMRKVTPWSRCSSLYGPPFTAW